MSGAPENRAYRRDDLALAVRGISTMVLAEKLPNRGRSDVATIWTIAYAGMSSASLKNESRRRSQS